MANPTAELLVKIGTDTKSLNKGLDAAGKKVGGFANTIKKHHRAIGLAMTAMGAAILATAVLSVKQFAKMGDEVQKMALRTGFSTEALSELRHAAELSGTSLAGLEKASRTLSGAILDAGFGLETYVRAFDKIGLSYEDLRVLSPEKQFIAVMEALAGLTDESEKAALAADLFGRAGTALLPMLANGAKGLAEMRQEAHDLGIVFDQEAANKAAAFNDALTKLKGSVTGVMIEVGSFLVDALKPLIDKVTEAITKFSDWSKEHPALAKALTFTAVAIGGLLVVLGPLLIMLPQLTAAYGILSGVIMTTIIPAVWAFVTALWAQVTATLAAMAATGVLIPAAIAAVAAITLLAVGITLLVKNQKKQYESTTAVTKATNELSESTAASTRLLSEQTELLESSASVRFENLRAILLEKEAQKELNAEMQKEIETRSDLLGIISQQLGMGASLASLSNLTWALTPFAKTRAGAAMGFSGLGIEGLAEGGVVTKPTLALIGEGGPEAVVPLDKMGGVTINFSEPVFMDNEETMQRFANKIYREIKKGQRLSFGGAYSG